MHAKVFGYVVEHLSSWKYNNIRQVNLNVEMLLL